MIYIYKVITLSATLRYELILLWTLSLPQGQGYRPHRIEWFSDTEVDAYHGIDLTLSQTLPQITINNS